MKGTFDLQKRKKDPKTIKEVEQPAEKKKKATSLDKMRSQLQGGRFRMLNEQLYTTTGSEAFKIMQVLSLMLSN